MHVSNPVNSIDFNFPSVFSVSEVEMAYFDQYHDSSSDYDDQSDDSTDDDGDIFVDCVHCASQVLERNYDNHLERVHKCSYCSNYMPKTSIPEHIKRKHMKNCCLCSVVLLEDLMAQHILRAHPSIPNETTGSIGMIELKKISTDKFNQLVKEQKVYAKDGQLFINKRNEASS